MLKPKTASDSATAGQIASHGARHMWSSPASESIPLGLGARLAEGGARRDERSREHAGEQQTGQREGALRPIAYLSASTSSGVSCDGLYPRCVGNSALSGHGFGNFSHSRSMWRFWSGSGPSTKPVREWRIV